MKAKSDAQIDGRVLEKAQQKGLAETRSATFLLFQVFASAEHLGRLTRCLRDACQRADAGHLELSAVSRAAEDRLNCCPKACAK